MNLEAINKWHKTTRTGHLTFGLAELGLTYLFVSLAINSGSLWQYALAIVLFAGSIQNFVKIFKAPKHGNNKR